MTYRFEAEEGHSHSDAAGLVYRTPALQTESPPVDHSLVREEEVHTPGQLEDHSLSEVDVVAHSLDYHVVVGLHGLGSWLELVHSLDP